MQLSTAINVLTKRAEDFYGKSFDWLIDEMDNGFDENLNVAIITPDLEIVENPNKLNPAFIVFDNYEIVLQWNRSLRFALAVCTLKEKIKNEL